MKLSKEETERILTIVPDIVAKAIGIFRNDTGWEGRSGGYLCVADRETGDALLRVRIGAPPNEKWRKYFNLCAGKALWLARHPECVSSWQGRALANGLPGGAIRTPYFILSFSGLTELGDEAAMLASAIELGWLDVMQDTDTIRTVMKISNNPCFARLAVNRPWSQVSENPGAPPATGC